MQILNHLIGQNFEEHNAKDFQDLICSILKQNNYSVKTEVVVPNRYDGRRGRVDIVAESSNETIAIEIDRNIPRKKSIFKLKSLDVDRIFTIVRSPFAIQEITK